VEDGKFFGAVHGLCWQADEKEKHGLGSNERAFAGVADASVVCASGARRLAARTARAPPMVQPPAHQWRAKNSQAEQQQAQYDHDATGECGG
jgi:hypothetical protein